MLTVAVEYQAPETIADPLGLSNSIQRRIEEHLRQANDIAGVEGSVRLCVTRCEMRPNFGRVQMQLSGTLNGQSFDHTLLAKDEPRRIAGRPTDRLIRSGFANLGTWLARLIRPSDLAVCLGNRRVSGRTLRAMEDCLSDAKVCLDRALGRPASHGTAAWNAAKRNSIYAALGSLLLVAAIYLFRRGQFRDEVRPIIACAAIPVGVFGIILNFGLARLPTQFFESEAAGRRLVALAGVKSTTAIRFVAVGLCLFSLLIGTSGVYWLLFE